MFFLWGNWGVERLAQHLPQIARRLTHLDRVHIEPPLSSPAALCVASEEALVCEDDEQRAIIQVTLEKNGVKNGVNLHYGGKQYSWRMRQLGTRSSSLSCQVKHNSWCTNGTVVQDITPRQKVENLNLKKKVSKSAVSKVKEDNNLKQLLQMVLRAVS